jgi:predicted AlkP superfamily phosphohydrolase/phosphomutase
VRYLRVLINVVLAGGLATCYILIVFLQLNPSLPLGLEVVGPLGVMLWLTYGLHFSVVSYVLVALRLLLAQDMLSPGWLSVRLLVWLCVAAAAMGAALMWLNLQGLRLALDDETARRMALGAAALTIAVGLLVVLGVYRYSLGVQGGRAAGVAFALIVGASVIVPLSLRVFEHDAGVRRQRLHVEPLFSAAPDGARLTMLLVDGASLDFISPAAADGRLPNFARLLDAGAVMHLATLRPTQPGPVWTAVATGKLPLRNGVRSAAIYRVEPGGPSFDLLPDYCFAHALTAIGFLSERPHSSVSVRARTLWSMLGASGVSVGIVRWPLTWPAEAVRGALVSDRLHMTDRMPEDPTLTYPPHLAATLPAALEPPEAAARAVRLQGDGEPAYPGAGALAADRFYARVLETLRRDRTDLRVLAARYQGVDVVGHRFLREAMPRAFGDVAEEERRRFGRVLEQYYRFIDGEVGRAIERLEPGDLLLVVSGFGMEPLSLPKRLLEAALGDRSLSGTHEGAPDGFLLAYGTPVRASRLPRASVVDVTPTVLYFFGLPVARDMDGYARTDIFAPAFTSERPLTVIPTYE